MKKTDKIIDMRDSGTRRRKHGKKHQEVNAMKENSKKKDLKRAIGIYPLDRIKKKQLQKPSFTALADSREQADRLNTLAEQALESHGLIYVRRDKEKNCTCWAVVHVVEDGREGKRVRRHYEIRFLAAAAGHEAELEQFEQDVIIVLRDRMMVDDRAQELIHKGKIYGPDCAVKFGKHAWFWYVPLLTVIISILTHDTSTALIFLLLFLSMDSSSSQYGAVRDVASVQADTGDMLTDESA